MTVRPGRVAGIKVPQQPERAIRLAPQAWRCRRTDRGIAQTVLDCRDRRVYTPPRPHAKAAFLIPLSQLDRVLEQLRWAPRAA